MQLQIFGNGGKYFHKLISRASQVLWGNSLPTGSYHERLACISLLWRETVAGSSYT